MTDFLLIVIIGQLAYMIYLFKNNNKTEEKDNKSFSYKTVLPEYLNKKVEIVLKKPLMEIDIMYSITGTLLDVDDEWVMIETIVKKKNITKMIRVENVGSIKEIR